MEKKLLVMIQHQLTPEQLQELNDLGFDNDNIEYLRDIDPALFGQVSNCPGDTTGLWKLASDMHTACDWYHAVLLPIGSPAFMTMFTSLLFGDESLPPKLLFSHSERESEDIPQEDGSVKKVSTFKHKHFIII